MKPKQTTNQPTNTLEMTSIDSMGQKRKLEFDSQE